MSPLWVVLVYGLAVATALVLLYFFHARSWYWHALSLVLAIVAGLTPMPATWQSARADLLFGFLFLFLFSWGIGGPVYRVLHHRKV